MSKNILNFICLLLGSIVMLSCTSSKGNKSDKKIEKKAEGVWVVSVGNPEDINLLNILNISPKIDALNAMKKADLPLKIDDIKTTVINGKTYLRFPLEKEEKIYGLGLNFKSVEQRGQIKRLHVDHYGGKDDGRTHAPIPFFVSSRGYGALINSARYIDVWAGTGVLKDSPNAPKATDRNTEKWNSRPYSDNLEFLIPAEGVEIILFAGPTMIDVVRRFNLYNGGGAMPPKWGLGFWARFHTLYNENDVLNEVKEYEKRNFPLSVVGLEPGWMSKSYPCTYEWDSNRFPNADSFIDSLTQKNIKINVWINPYVSPASEVYDKIKPLTGSHTVWCGVVPDYSLPEVKKIMTGHFKKHQVSKGISGYKMDENDGYDYWLWPDVAQFPSGLDGEQMRQIYGSLMQDMTYNMYRSENKRTYGLVRAANAGTSSYPFVLYNDYYNHRDFITALINSSFIGVLWTPEVRSSNNSEDWIRRIQSVCFSPIAMLDAWASKKNPWSFPDVYDMVKEIVNLRMRLIPYIYTVFADYSFYGTPPVRAMNLEEGYSAETTIISGKLDDTKNPYNEAIKREVKDQFMVGDNLLVAPLFEGEKERKIILPQGKWYDFYTGELAGDGEIITVKPELDKIPVYVKDGGIIPLWPELTCIDGKKHPLEIRHYGTKNGIYELYDDDGETFDYEKGEYIRISIKVNVDVNGNKKLDVNIPKSNECWSYSNFTFRDMNK